ncbi:hypothetical protein J5N97_002251 [Dioscorea zingiberensis]|uniref:BHLH domain-containing protein n=1 Tax=Dioscorea zingiberensis TaxID=325984 RepID=A0A9D5HP15_9LILI|nr:hypothetical protein J5N97_002251 [Dioscorea zingiberensis]
MMMKGDEDDQEDQKQVMRSFPSVYKGTLILPKPSFSPWFVDHHQGQHHGMMNLYNKPSSKYSSSSSSSSERSASALRVHSQAEKLRRERINAHLSTLRRMLFPDAHKMDKASLLGKVVEQVKELKRKTMDIDKSYAIPSATNEVIVESKCDDEVISDNKVFFIKASVCCDDRPDLFASMINAFQVLNVRTVRADMMSLGGRVHIVFILCNKEGQESTVCLSSLMESIRQALTRVVSSDVASGKRRRLMQPSYSNMS